MSCFFGSEAFPLAWATKEAFGILREGPLRICSWTKIVNLTKLYLYRFLILIHAIELMISIDFLRHNWARVNFRLGPLLGLTLHHVPIELFLVGLPLFYDSVESPTQIFDFKMGSREGALIFLIIVIVSVDPLIIIQVNIFTITAILLLSSILVL